MEPEHPAEPAPTGTGRREPVRMPWLGVAFAAVVLVGVPFYLPSGVVGPLVGGVPLWLWGSAAATVAFAALTCWACLRAWNLVEDEEQATGAPIGPRASDRGSAGGSR